MSHISDGKLFQTVVSKFLAHHEVKDLINHFRLAVQVFKFKTFKGLTLINFIKLILELIRDPWHWSGVRLNIIDFKTPACENLNLRWVETNFFFGKSIVVFSIDSYYESVLGWGLIVGPHLLERYKAYDCNCKREKLSLRVFSQFSCYNLFTHL